MKGEFLKKMLNKENNLVLAFLFCFLQFFLDQYKADIVQNHQQLINPNRLTETLYHLNIQIKWDFLAYEETHDYNFTG